MYAINEYSGLLLEPYIAKYGVLILAAIVIGVTALTWWSLRKG